MPCAVHTHVARLSSFLTIAVLLCLGHADAQDLSAADVARADVQVSEPFYLVFDAALATPLTAPQTDLFGLGGSVSVGGYQSFASWVAGGLRLRATWLTAGETPAGQVTATSGAAYDATLLLRLRLGSSPQRGTGLWLEGGGGGSLTGDLFRPAVEAALGYGFDVGSVDVAPSLRYVQIIDGSSELDSRDARILMIGLELTLFDARPVPSAPPPSDRDGDRILDERDACPDVAEDYDAYEDTDGCPESDNDQDGIVDSADQCPNAAEDRDQFQDEDGCPDPDNDGDGILDVTDRCPNEPEVVNGVEDQDGCPDEGLIQLIDDRIVIEERILFDFERSRIRRDAFKVLDAIAELVRQHPEWKKFRVEGHADARGLTSYNNAISQRRADAVANALIERGIGRDTIASEGFGATRLRDPGTTAVAHQRNRRVEFVVVERSPLPTASSVAPTEGAVP